MAKKKDKEAEDKLGPPRNWTVEQRREKFLKMRNSTKADFRILDKDFREELVPYNHLVLDRVLGLGGIARHGRITQIHGNEGAGKTTMALCIAAQYQRITGEPVGIFEYEPTASIHYAFALGIDPDLCFYEQPTNLQRAIARHVELMEDAGVRFFVDDSIPYMETKVPRRDIESGKAFKGNYGSHAKGIKAFYHLLHPYLLENDGAILVVNQTRARIDDDAEYASRWSYTNREYSLPGGYAARFAPSVMVELYLVEEVRPWEWGKMPDEKEKWLLIQPRGEVASNYPTAIKVRARSLKNKVTGMGFREGYVYIRPNLGIDENMSVRELACAYDLVAFDKKKWYVGKSLDDAIATYPSKTELVEALVIKQDPEVLGKLRGMVTEAVASDDTERFRCTPPAEAMAYAAEEEGEYKFQDEEDFGKTPAEAPATSVKDIEEA